MVQSAAFWRHMSPSFHNSIRPAYTPLRKTEVGRAGSAAVHCTPGSRKAVPGDKSSGKQRTETDSTFFTYGAPQNGQNSHRPRSPEAYSPKIHYRDRGRSGSDASRRRSRRRLLLLALLSTIAFSLYLYHVYAADPSSSRGTLPPQSNPPVGPHQKDGTAPSKRWFWFRSTARRRASAPSSSFGTRLQSSKYPYILPNELLPVHHEERHVIYHNGPLAPTRPPPNQFLLDPRADLSQPVVGIITATNNPREVMRETAASLFAQSLQNFVWIIVSDHTTQSASAAILRDLARDPRVHVVTNTGAQGLSEGRNVGIEWLLAHYDPPPPYLISLDDDDLFELTALEKACWMLESNPTWDLAGFRYIKFGAANETVVTGLHSNAANYKAGNFVPNAAIYTSRALLASGCRYDEKEFDEGGEDWDFWMCLAEHGHWGGSLLEPLYWCAAASAAALQAHTISLARSQPIGTASTRRLFGRNDGARLLSAGSKRSRRTCSDAIPRSRPTSRPKSPSRVQRSSRSGGTRRSGRRWRTRTGR